MILLTHELPVHGIKVFLDKDDPEHNHISSYLPEVCPCCNQQDCFFNCDDSQAEYKDKEENAHHETYEQALDRIEYNRAIDGVLHTILGHAIAGVDIESPAYLEGIETAVQRISAERIDKYEATKSKINDNPFIQLNKISKENYRER